MVFNRKTLVFLLVSLFIVAGIAATNPPEDHTFKNLKVLPKNISKQDLDKVMDGFKAALGVKCGFCHVPFKDTSNHHMDFASDEKPEKNIAREMMRMAAKINKKFFKDNKNEKGEPVPAVECMTCHHGKEHPEGPGHQPGGPNQHPDASFPPPGGQFPPPGGQFPPPGGPPNK